MIGFIYFKGVTCILVTDGVTEEVLEEGLAKFAENAEKR